MASQNGGHVQEHADMVCLQPCQAVGEDPTQPILAVPIQAAFFERPQCALWLRGAKVALSACDLSC
jgi:hypothetical protein